MFHHRQVIVRLRQGDTDREIAVESGVKYVKVLAHYRTRSAHADEGTLEGQLRHLFSRELMAVEIRLGFNTFQCAAGERVQTYFAFLNADSFRAQLKLGHHWKDPGVPGNHGEYTHRLQWYLLANALKDVVKEPVKQFMRIGGVIDPNKENAPSGLWDALFDRNDGEGLTKFKVHGNVTDCRSPESLTKFIVDDVNADKWPLVHWYIKSRMKKRQTKPLNQFHAAKSYVEGKIKKFGLNITRGRRSRELAQLPGQQGALHPEAWRNDSTHTTPVRAPLRRSDHTPARANNVAERGAA